MDYLLTFLEGFASFISPCILPLVPIYISYFMGASEESNKKSKAFINSLFFVLGFTIIFILIAILATTVGQFFSQYLKYIKIAFGIILIFLGLDYMDIIRIKFPNFNLKNSFNTQNLNIIKSLVFGVLFSISHAPCTGVFLASALALIAQEQNILKGIFLMLLYSLGLGIPFIISALIIDKMKKVFNLIKNHYKLIKVVCGIIIIATGIYIML